jgi:hypothetical protein
VLWCSGAITVFGSFLSLVALPFQLKEVTGSPVTVGGFDMVSGIFRSTLWNQTIPDGLRGRLAGIELLSFSAGPQLGQLRPGGMAALTSVRASVWGGGLLCVGAVGVLPKLMSLRRPGRIRMPVPSAKRLRPSRRAEACPQPPYGLKMSLYGD